MTSCFIGRAAAIAVAALAFASVASTAAADPETVCAPAAARWDRAAAGGSPAEMRAAMKDIPGVCDRLLARARARYAAVVTPPEPKPHHPPPERIVEHAPEPAPPPPVYERTESLEDVFDLLKNELVAQGAVAFEGFAHDSAPAAGTAADWTYTKRLEFTNFNYDLPNCDFDFNFKLVENGKTSKDGPAGVPFRQVSTIETAELTTFYQVRDAQAGHPTYSARVSPQIYAVEAIRTDGSYNEFDFYNLEVAKRVSQLLQRAAEKCGQNPTVRFDQPSAAPPPVVQSESIGGFFDQIQNALVAQGPVAFEGFAHDSDPPAGKVSDWTYTKRMEYTAFRNDIANCQLNFHFKLTVNGAVSSDIDAGVPLKMLTEIKVAPETEFLQVRDAQAGHPTYSSRLQPQIYTLDLVRNTGGVNEFSFYNLDTARQVARLFQQAAGACGMSPEAHY